MKMESNNRIYLQRKYQQKKSNNPIITFPFFIIDIFSGCQGSSKEVHAPDIKIKTGLERFLNKWGEDYLITIRRRLINQNDF